MRTLVIGAGAYGLALSYSLKGEVFVYSSISDEIDLLNKTRRSDLFDVSFGDNIHFVNSIDFSYDLIIVALPSVVIKSEFDKLDLIDVPVIIASKGICDGKFIYDILKDFFSSIYVLSGPSFASDMINGESIVLTLAGPSELDIFKDNIKLEYTNDIFGVELCGILKNVFAISCGILNGMEVSDSTKAAFLNLVINETMNILFYLECDPSTIFLACGMGDIILTCTSSNSRNYSFGYMIGQGCSSNEINEYLKVNTVEGVNTLNFLKDMIQNDLADLIYNIIYNGVDCSKLLEYIVK